MSPTSRWARATSSWSPAIRAARRATRWPTSSTTPPAGATRPSPGTTALAALVDAAGIKDPDIAVKYASTVRGWENTMKNYTGQVEGLERIGDAQRKRDAEAA